MDPNQRAERPDPPERVGPYRIEERIGRGGMGEVFRAYDERLDRRVAIKHVSPALAGDETSRKRFRREARAAAGLSHPAIVQIHDIVETGAGDWIVMELIEGESLARLLEDGSLALGRALGIARRIAEGLAEAHAQGIVHRDLKTENVMLTASGHAKILDFGLAKRQRPEGGESQLSSEGKVMGTSRSMSPEQAIGNPVDHRSDLFSFGVLLYEMVTGRSPFVGGSTTETLARILTHRQRPAGDLTRDLPPALSALIDDLLEKEPIHRPQSALAVRDALERIASGETGEATARQPTYAGETTRFDLTGASTARPPRPGAAPPGAPEPVAVPQGDAVTPPRRRSGRWLIAATVTLVALFAAVAFIRFRPAADPVYVAVLDPVIGAAADTRDVELIAAGVGAALLRGVSSFEAISALTPTPHEDRRTPVEVARALAADEVLASRLDCAALACQVTLNRLDGDDGGVLWSRSFQVPADDVLALHSAVLANLRRGFRGYRLRREAPDLDVRGEDYEAYLRLRRAFYTREEGLELDEILTRLGELAETSPRFLDAHLLAGRIAHSRYLDSRDPQDLERSLAAIEQARKLAPEDPQALIRRFDVALDGGRLELAADALAELERLEPGHARLLAQRALLLERQGQLDEALALMRTAVARHPSWGNLYDLANMEYRGGDVEAARRHLRELLERSPENFGGRLALAQIELMSGEPEAAAELYESLLRRSPSMTILTNLGVAHFLLRDYERAASSLRRALTLQPESPSAILNLADAELLLGRREAAEALYRRVLELIPENAGQWQHLSIRAQAFAHLDRAQEAVLAIQQAILLAPDHPEAAYEAALVYALVGETTSALVYARKAVEAGVEPRWFTFPWFEPLRSDPAFTGLFAG